MDNSVILDRILPNIKDPKFAEEFIKKFNYCRNNIHNPKIKFSDLDGSLNYISGMHTLKPTLHLGQRKLLLSEIQFLTLNHTHSKYVVYAGAGPGHHIHYLYQLFPHLKFILVDPTKFAIYIDNKIHRFHKSQEIVHLVSSYPHHSNFYNFGTGEYGNWSEASQNNFYKASPTELCNFIRNSNHSLFIIEDYFTNDLAQKLKDLNALFISDIRSKNDKMDNPTDLDVLWDMCLQFNWINIMKPPISMVKFRQPYFENTDLDDFAKRHKILQKDFEIAKMYGIDFISDYKKRDFRYFGGIKYVQAWAGQISTETRLHIREMGIRQYDWKDYESKMFYYNSIERGFCKHINPYIDPTVGFDRCGDCSIEANIWENYIKEFKKTKKVIDYVKETEEKLRKNIKRDFHGISKYVKN